MDTRWVTGVLAFGAVAAVVANLIRDPSLRTREQAARISVEPPEILANGYRTATLAIEGGFGETPRVVFANNIPGVSLAAVTGGHGKWRTTIHAGVVPGRLRLRVESSQHLLGSAGLTLLVDSSDRFADGTPDFLRLDSDHDRQTFRRWFTYLAEVEYFRPADTRPTEINDCAALIRYAYREALHAHDSPWADSVRMPSIPAFDSVEKYAYPFTPLGPSLFRVKSGSFELADLAAGTFLQFADAKTLWRYNTHLVGRELSRALPGDLLFYRQDSGPVTYHSMIYLGESQVRVDDRRYVLYHTGPEGSNSGAIKRLTIEELTHYPQPEWRPIPSNRSFLGVARWNILSRGSEVMDARMR